MAEHNNEQKQTLANDSDDYNMIGAIPAETTIADAIQLIREISLQMQRNQIKIDMQHQQTCERQERIEAEIAYLRDRINRPSRNRSSSLSSDKRNRENIVNIDNQPQRTFHSAPKLPTPTPQAPAPFFQAFTPSSQTRLNTQETNQNQAFEQSRILSNNNRHNAPSLSPKDYLEAVPYFDGTPAGYDASEFIKHCKNASAYIPQYREYEILTLLIGRLKGEVLHRACKAKLRTIHDLINFIKENFDKPKTYFSLRCQILTLKQGVNESMSTYIARTQELLYDCTEQLYASNTRNKQTAEQTLNDDITSGFVHGIQSKYLKLFTTKDFLNFAAARAEARRAEEELAEYPQLDDTEIIRKNCFAIQTINYFDQNNYHTNNNNKPA
ncbi:hypothetical protein PV327_011473, partial [Microctonus hyperodae]